MDQLVAEIEAYAAARGVAPGTIVQYATKLGGTAFRKWKDGESSCELATADRIRAYIRENPAPAPAAGAAARPAQGEGAVA